MKNQKSDNGKGRLHAFRLSDAEQQQFIKLLEERNRNSPVPISMSAFIREQVLRSNNSYDIKRLSLCIDTIALEMKQLNNYLSSCETEFKEFFIKESLRFLKEDFEKILKIYSAISKDNEENAYGDNETSTRQ